MSVVDYRHKVKYASPVSLNSHDGWLQVVLLPASFDE